MVHWWNDADKEKLKYLEKNMSYGTLSTTNPNGLVSGNSSQPEMERWASFPQWIRFACLILLCCTCSHYVHICFLDQWCIKPSNQTNLDGHFGMQTLSLEWPLKATNTLSMKTAAASKNLFEFPISTLNILEITVSFLSFAHDVAVVKLKTH